MKAELLDLLTCPACAGSLELRDEDAEVGEIRSGTLACSGCRRGFDIRGGIPCFAAPGDSPDAATAERFGYQWTVFDENLEEYRAAFLDWIAPLGPADLVGSAVLDAGCGMGRFSAAAADLGARSVVAVDVSESVKAAGRLAGRRPHMHVVQADLLALPLRPAFDLVLSIGVLHHLPDGEAGFRALLRHAKPGGRIHIWVYGREGNAWLLRFVDPIRRRITSRLPPPLLRAVALGLAVPLHLLLAGAYRNSPATSRLPYAPYLRWLAGFPLRHTHQVVFDHLAAPIAHYYGRDEVSGWFERAGLSDVVLTPRNANSWRATGRLPGGG